MYDLDRVKTTLKLALATLLLHQVLGILCDTDILMMIYLLLCSHVYYMIINVILIKGKAII